MSLRKETYTIPGSNGRPMLLDINFEEGRPPAPVIVYAHGFNGFKDWGNFDLVARTFVDAGFTFVKFNFSHNGTTIEQPEDFADLDAFSRNNYSLELHDLKLVFDWIAADENPCAGCIDKQRPGLIGHSMGGGIAVIAASEDPRIKALSTWAAIAVCTTPWGSWPPEKIAAWRETGIQHYLNGRTRQQMPMLYQLYEDYNRNKERLDIIRAAGRLQIPFLICHGSHDPAVPVAAAYRLHEADPSAELCIVESDHVFGRKHPWPDPAVPPVMQQVLERNIAFFSKTLLHG